MMINALTFVRKHLIYLILISMGLGLANGHFNQVGYLKSLILPILLLMVLPMMVNIKIEEVLNAFKDFKPVGLSLAVNFIFMPVLALVVAWIFFQDQPIYAVGLYLVALLPTSGMTAAWTGMAKGNLNTALVIIAVNLLLSIFILPLYLKFMVNQAVPFDPVHIFQQLLYIVVAPMLAGDLIRRLIVRRWGKEGYLKVKPHLSSISSLGVVLIIFLAMSLKAGRILGDLGASALVLAPIVVFYFLAISAGLILGRMFLARDKMIALVYGTAMRDLSIAVAIAMLSFPEAVMPIALAYAIQVPTAAVIMKVLLRLEKRRPRVAVGERLKSETSLIGS